MSLDAVMHEHASYTRLPAFGGVELLRAEYRTHAFAPHAHETFAIGVFEAGGAVVRCESRVFDAAVADILTINPGAVHSARAGGRDGWRYRALYPDAATVQALLEESGQERLAPEFAAPSLCDAGVAHRLKVALARLDRLEPADAPLAAEELLVAIVHHLWRAAGRPGAAPPVLRADPPAVARARAFIEAHVDGAPSLAAIAEVAGLSRYHLIRVFARTVGLTPHAYFMQCRVARARALLAAGEAPARVAARCGFADQSHLTRQFKRLVGVTPGAFASGVVGHQRVSAA